MPDRKFTPEQSLNVLYRTLRKMRLSADDHEILLEHVMNVRQNLKTDKPNA